MPLTEATARSLALNWPAHLIGPLSELLSSVRRKAWLDTGSARATARIEAGVLCRCELLIVERPSIGMLMLEQRIQEFAIRETQLYEREMRRNLIGRVLLLFNRLRA